MALGTYSFSQSYNEATNKASSKASHEAPPAAHPITNTALPQSTGAGKGRVRTGRTR